MNPRPASGHWALDIDWSLGLGHWSFPPPLALLPTHPLRSGRGRGIFRRDVEGDHEPVGPLELVRLLPLRDLAGRFDLVGHEDEAVVARRAPVLEVVDHYRLAAVVAGEALERQLGGLAAVELCDGVVLVGL